jgi:hypothetical protein
MSLIKTIDQIDITSLVNSYCEIENSIRWSPPNSTINWQTGLQYKVGDDPWTSAGGKSKGDELSYSELNPFFKNTIFEDIITKYKLKRTRLMWVGSKTCYSFHSDQTPRIHIPLITNPDCYFLFKTGIMFNLNINSVYWVNTTKIHTFINCSDFNRLHLVGIVNE